MSRRHEISSAPENMVWGYVDSTTKPVLEIASGDTVTLHSFPAGGKETLPPDLSIVPADYLAALDQLVQGAGPHFITGPVYVKGAMPGDVLQIDILDVKVRQDWGFVAILPLLGTLPDARLHVQKGCAHVPPLQAPEAFLDAIAPFLTNGAQTRAA